MHTQTGTNTYTNTYSHNDIKTQSKEKKLYKQNKQFKKDRNHFYTYVHKYKTLQILSKNNKKIFEQKTHKHTEPDTQKYLVNLSHTKQWNKILT